MIIDCGNGEILTSLPSGNEKDQLRECCIVYDHEEAFKKDKKYSKIKVNKILVDDLIECVLKQSFDHSNMCVTAK